MKALALAWVLALVSCARAPREELTRAPSAAAVWVEDVARAHAAADAQGGDAARKLLERARARAVPAAISAEDRRQLLQDLQFRLAILALDAGDPARASAESERGLALGQADDTYTTNLLIVQGRAAGVMGKHEAAVAAYASALAIHERLLQQALEGAP